MSEVIHIKTISELHEHLGLPAATHDLITIIQHDQLVSKLSSKSDYISDLYGISLMDSLKCKIGYGEASYEFDSRTMLFVLPGQTTNINNIEYADKDNGWSIAFHPDLLSKSDLGVKIAQYTFFNYEINKALKVSPIEASILNDIRKQIEHETCSNFDRHTQAILRAKLELILSYCVRFYDRQFQESCHIDRDYVKQFDVVLNSYYLGKKHSELGIPTVQYCGQQLGISPYYLSNILKRETGMSALEYIHNFLVDKAKILISENNLTISQVAYSIGFEYPQHFSRLFKSKTGMSPRGFKLALETGN